MLQWDKWFGNRVGYRGKSLQPYVGYSLEGNYFRGCGRRLSASRRGLEEFQLRLSFVEEAWLPQTTCRGGVPIRCPSRPPVMGSIDSVARLVFELIVRI